MTRKSSTSHYLLRSPRPGNLEPLISPDLEPSPSAILETPTLVTEPELGNFETKRLSMPDCAIRNSKTEAKSNHNNDQPPQMFHQVKNGELGNSSCEGLLLPSVLTVANETVVVETTKQRKRVANGKSENGDSSSKNKSKTSKFIF